jgi:hypothetical protein
MVVTDAPIEPALLEMLRVTGHHVMKASSAAHARVLIQDIIPSLAVIGSLDDLNDVSGLLEELSRICRRVVVAPLSDEIAILLAERLGLLAHEGFVA